MYIYIPTYIYVICRLVLRALLFAQAAAAACL